MEKYVSGIGVVTSAGVYRRLMGKMATSFGVVSKLGANLRIPRPLVVVASGNTTTVRVGLARRRVATVAKVVPFGGDRRGGEKARRIAVRRVICSTFLVVGYEAVKTGSNMAAM